MSKIARAVGTIAGVVATVAAFIPGGQVVAAAASGIAAISSTVAQLTAKPPAPQGSATNIVLDPNSPMPYSMGRTYVGGHIAHDVGYGPTRDDIENPNRSTVYIYSGAGPVHSFEKTMIDFNQYTPGAGGAVGGYYAGALYYTSQLGQAFEPSALENSGAPSGVGYTTAIPDWSAQHKLSSWAAAIATYVMDDKGKIFGGGIPQMGAIGKWVKCYDPRKDSTYPGGAGTHRFNDESTWEWTENPALHALTYIYGRYSQNPNNPGKIFGIGLSPAAIDTPRFVIAANICDANNWTVGGTIYEPGDKWNNLKLIMEAGGMTPGWRGAMISCDVHSPMVPLDTITKDDLADGAYEVPGMQPWRSRLNAVIPEFRSEAHNWEHVPGSKVSVAAYVTEDGQEKPKGHKFTLVQDATQAAQLSGYMISNSREIGPIVLPLKPRLMSYGHGDTLRIDIEELGLDHIVKVTGRDVDIASGTVTMSFVTDDPLKHPLALGQTTVAPPSPSLLVPGYLDNIRDSLLTAAVVDRVVTSDPYVNLVGTVATQAQALAQETLDRNAALAQAQIDFRAGLIDQAGLDAVILATNNAFDAAIQTEANARGVAIAAALTDEVADRNAAIAAAETAFRNGLIDQAGLDSAIGAANNAFAQAISDEATARDLAISGALSNEATARDAAIAAAETAFRNGLIDQAGLDSAIGAANNAFAVALQAEVDAREAAIANIVTAEGDARDAAIAAAEADFLANNITAQELQDAIDAANLAYRNALSAARDRIESLEVYNANSTQLINDDGTIEGIRWIDDNDVEQVTPYHIFWDAFGIVTDAGVSGPFLYDPVANVTYMNTAFIKHLSVETIHVRDGSITRPTTLRQGSPAVGNMGNVTSTAMAQFGTHIIIEAGGFLGQSIYTSVGFQIFNNWSAQGVVNWEIRKQAYTDPGLTAASKTIGDPGLLMTRGTAYLHPRVDTTINASFIDEGVISYGDSWTTYVLRLSKSNNYNQSSSIILRHLDFNSLLSKR